jgi:hypothetical protein
VAGCGCHYRSVTCSLIAYPGGEGSSAEGLTLLTARAFRTQREPRVFEIFGADWAVRPSAFEKPYATQAPCL